jgi:hypothetical protein
MVGSHYEGIIGGDGTSSVAYATPKGNRRTTCHKSAKPLLDKQM